MSNQRYSPEFKDKAVRQVLERGHSVSQVSERLGVSVPNEGPHFIRVLDTSSMAMLHTPLFYNDSSVLH